MKEVVEKETIAVTVVLIKIVVEANKATDNLYYFLFMIPVALGILSQQVISFRRNVTYFQKNNLPTILGSDHIHTHSFDHKSHNRMKESQNMKILEGEEGDVETKEENVRWEFGKNTTGVVRQAICKEPILCCYLYDVGAKRVTPNHQMLVLLFEFSDVILCPDFHNFIQSFQGNSLFLNKILEKNEKSQSLEIRKN
ncbi:Hypothetical predicted protein [Octopus vulgaris]|uniref:Uncharacterized protein n=1 Tax=Octopus vulgaris TaxID=6645 RepID=A0AA36FAN3_OCTVU|nr:Hypothetical predicted protein [Octopus vulgaris]